MKWNAISSRAERRRTLAYLAILGIVLLCPLRSHAYAGPGAGFAVLSSFWTLFVAFLYSVYAFFVWPFRQLFRLLRRRKAYGKAQIKRAVILGFDGMDPELTERFIAEGRLPNMAKLRGQGTFRKLRTTYPAISPVAWSTFMTGVNPGKHNIYDFLARDLANYLPYLSSAEIKGPKRSLENWQIHHPPRRPQNQRHAPRNAFLALARRSRHLLLRASRPGNIPSGEIFRRAPLWDVCSRLERQSGNVLLVYNSHQRRQIPRGRRPRSHRALCCTVLVLRSRPRGSADPEAPATNFASTFEIHPDPSKNQARFTVDGEKFTLKVGEYSEWIPVTLQGRRRFQRSRNLSLLSQGAFARSRSLRDAGEYRSRHAPICPSLTPSRIPFIFQNSSAPTRRSAWPKTPGP